MSTDAFPFGQPFAWSPDPEAAAATTLGRLWRDLGLDGYDALAQWATDDIGRFWTRVLDDLGVVFETSYTQILDTARGPEHARWCVGGRMNITVSMLDRWRSTPRWEQDAIRYESEEGHVTRLTTADLHTEVERAAAGLRAMGLGPGDAVGLYMPLTPEEVVAFLAVVRIGGIVLPLFSGYGTSAVADRLGDADARAVIVADGSVRRGKSIPMKPTLDAALADAPTVEHVIVVTRAGLDVPMTDGRDSTWSDLLARGTARLGDDPEAGAPEIVDAEAPLMIIYTSGTTGRPKGAVHTHCGFPIKAAQDMVHPMDLQPGDVMWWMTDMGWMMGPWLVFGTLLGGATMVLFDGAPDTPGVDRVWQLCVDHDVTHLGVSPVLIRALMPHGTEAVARHDLSALRACGSTGSPWDPESWRWLFEHVLESRKPILNYSGGTEISGGIVCGDFVRPLKPCGFPGAVLGMDADVLDDDGQPVRGAVGEFAIRQPWIGMTRGFWRDDERYLDSYWRRHPGVWVHGDFAAIDADGQWFILGRSDDTIKIAGKRLGPAEAEGAVCADPDVIEAAAIGVPDDVKGEALVVFCVLREGTEADDILRARLGARLADALGKALRPKAVYVVRALPKTRNAKVMRRVIRAVHLGTEVGNVTALEDESTLDAIRDAR
ncbi:MAG: AMP-binding protein [Bacteroidota bacterium]